MPCFCSARAAASPEGPAPMTAYLFMVLPARRCARSVAPRDDRSRAVPWFSVTEPVEVSETEVSNPSTGSGIGCGSGVGLALGEHLVDGFEERMLRLQPRDGGGESAGVLDAQHLLQLDGLLVVRIVE